MNKWDYKIISSVQTFNLDETLQKLGLEGWEAVSVSHYYPKNIKNKSVQNQEMVVLLKQLKED